VEEVLRVWVGNLLIFKHLDYNRLC
jgi:hypothetical protein